MTLIKSISGIRGTVGGEAGDNLTPSDIVRFTVGYSRWLLRQVSGRRPVVAVGRDARLSGEMVYSLVEGTLMGGGGGVDGVDGGTAGKQHRGCDGKQGGKCCFHDFLRKKNSFFHTIPPLCRFGKSGGWFFREFPQSIRQNRRKW